VVVAGWQWGNEVGSHTAGCSTPKTPGGCWQWLLVVVVAKRVAVAVWQWDEWMERGCAVILIGGKWWLWLGGSGGNGGNVGRGSHSRVLYSQNAGWVLAVAVGLTSGSG
jgi:hypothetical protein